MKNEHDQERLFKNIDACLDFVKVFKVQDFNVRHGVDQKGSKVVQLVYAQPRIDVKYP